MNTFYVQALFYAGEALLRKKSINSNIMQVLDAPFVNNKYSRAELQTQSTQSHRKRIICQLLKV
jgi:hypothetical protein